MSFHKRINEPKPDTSEVIYTLTDAGKHLLEVQQRPSSEYADEWRTACYEMRIALRIAMKWITNGHWDEWVDAEIEREDEEEEDGTLQD